HRLPVIDTHAGGHFARAKYRLVDHVRRELNGLRNRNASDGVDADCINRAAVIDEALKLDDLRDKVQIDSRRIASYYRFDFESHTGVARFPILRSCWRDHDGHNSTHECRARAADGWNLWLSVCPRISKFSDDLDDSALTALCGHTWRREEIDSLFFVERANHH